MKNNAVRNPVVEHLSRLGDASIHDFDDADRSFARVYHFHNTLEVIIVKQGWMEGLVAGVMGKLDQGTMVVIGDDVPHCMLRSSEDCQVLLIHIPAELLRWDGERFPELSHGMDYIKRSRCGMVYRDISFAHEVTELAEKITASDGFMRMSHIMCLLHRLSTTTPSSTLLTGEPPLLRSEDASSLGRAYRYIYANFQNVFTLAQVAGYAGMHPSALSRAFKKLSGCSIGQFCLRLRVERACNLLLTTDLNIGQVGYAAGFRSYGLYCTQFRRAMKMTPTEYREEVRKIHPDRIPVDDD